MGTADRLGSEARGDRSESREEPPESRAERLGSVEIGDRPREEEDGEYRSESPERDELEGDGGEEAGGE